MIDFQTQRVCSSSNYLLRLSHLELPIHLKYSMRGIDFEINA